MFSECDDTRLARWVYGLWHDLTDPVCVCTAAALWNPAVDAVRLFPTGSACFFLYGDAFSSLHDELNPDHAPKDDGKYLAQRHTRITQRNVFSFLPI